MPATKHLGPQHKDMRSWIADLDAAVAARLSTLGVAQDYLPPESLAAEIRSEQRIVEEKIRNAAPVKQ